LKRTLFIEKCSLKRTLSFKKCSLKGTLFDINHVFCRYLIFYHRIYVINPDKSDKCLSLFAKFRIQPAALAELQIKYCKRPFTFFRRCSQQILYFSQKIAEQPEFSDDDNEIAHFPDNLFSLIIKQ
jgi:hypothetical protein